MISHQCVCLCLVTCVISTQCSPLYCLSRSLEGLIWATITYVNSSNIFPGCLTPGQRQAWEALDRLTVVGAGYIILNHCCLASHETLAVTDYTLDFMLCYQTWLPRPQSSFLSQEFSLMWSSAACGFMSLNPFSVENRFRIMMNACNKLLDLQF